jgi:hypothetical protein
MALCKFSTDGRYVGMGVQLCGGGNVYTAVNSCQCPRSYLFENGICGCWDKLHGAPGWETGLICPILAVPLGTATIIPLGHAVFIHVIVPITIFSLSLFAYDSCRFECCVKKINDLSFYLSFFLVIFHKPAAIR